MVGFWNTRKLFLIQTATYFMQVYVKSFNRLLVLLFFGAKDHITIHIHT